MTPEQRAPRGWSFAKFGDLCDDKGAYGANVPKIPFDPRLPRYVRITDIDDSGRLNAKDLASIRHDAAAPYLIEQGDILLARSGATVGKSYLHRERQGQYAHAGYLIRFRTRRDLLLPEFMAQYLRSPPYWSWVKDTQRAQAQPNINAAEYGSLLIPLPPLPEQRKIAAILSSVDEAIEGTQAVIDQLQVVKKAMMADLLTRGIPGRHKTFKQTEIGEIPAEWDVVPLCEVASLQTGLAKGKPIANGLELPYLRVANVQDGYVDLSEIKTITVESSSIERYRLKAGDVLFTEGGDADKLGRGCVWLGQVNPCLHQNHVFAVRPNPERLLSRYLAYVAAAPVGKQYFLNCAKQTTNLASINSTQLKALPVPLATVDEQTAIVAVVDSCDARIAAEVSCLESLQSTKQSLMSVLLTGEIRVQVDEEVAA